MKSNVEVLNNLKYLDELPEAFCILEVLDPDDSHPSNYVIKYANNELSRLSGFNKDKILNATFDDIFPNSKEKWFEIIKTTAFEGKKQNVIKYIPLLKRFISTDLYRMEDGYCGCIIKEVIGYKDSLMNCLSLDGFKIRAEEIITNNPKLDFVFWYCDIKHFKFINMNYGYDEGDHVLSFISHEIQKYLSDYEIMGRISGDIFIIMSVFKNHQYSIDRFNELLLSSEKKLEFEVSHSHKIDIAAGAYISYASTRESIDIIRFIDYAHSAEISAKKEKGSYFEFFSNELFEEEKRADEIIKHLPSALSNNEVDIYLQPQYNYLEGFVSGAEVLARWKHPEFGNISPAEFIPVLEKSGHIFEFDIYIWDRALKFLKRLNNLGYFIPVSINLSRNDIFSNRIINVLINLTDKYGIDRKYLHLEITETSYINNPKQLIDVVNELSDNGFHVEMDDFGSGFSSLSMFKDLSIRTIKLDLNFMKNLRGNNKSVGIISSIVRMAHNAGVSVIAEGVESKNQAEFLKNVGCFNMQGFFFSKPLPKEEFTRLLISSSLGDQQKEEHECLFDDLVKAFNNSDYLFGKCIGPSVVVEYINDSIEIVYANDEFQMLNMSDFSTIDFKNPLSSPFEESEVKVIKEAIKETVKKGTYKLEHYFKRTDKHFRIKYTLITRSSANAFIFIELSDLS